MAHPADVLTSCATTTLCDDGDGRFLLPPRDDLAVFCAAVAAALLCEDHMRMTTDGLLRSGGTDTAAGIASGQADLVAHPAAPVESRARIMIIITDGVPNSRQAAATQALAAKGATPPTFVYAVSLLFRFCAEQICWWLRSMWSGYAVLT